MRQTNCKVIGLTGGIASGKSTVSSILMEKGFRVIDSDIISREVVEPGQPGYKELVTYFGNEILYEDGSLNRKVLGDIVFSNEELLEILNNITHPYIFKELIKKINVECFNNIVFVDIPLLFERFDELIKQDIIFDETWLIYTDEVIQLERLILRNNLSEKEAINRIKSQMPLKEKKGKATRIIDNNGDIAHLSRIVEELLNELI